MKKISLWHFILGLHSGGVEKVIEMYFSNIDTSVFDLHIVTHMKNDHEIKKQFEKMGFQVHELHSVHGYKIGKQNLKEYNDLFSSHQMDIVHNHQPNNMLPLYFAKKFQVKVRILHSHNNYRANISHINPIKQKLYRIGLKINVNNATALFSCGKRAAKTTFGEKIFDSGAVHIVPNAIYPETFAFHQDTRLKIREKLNLGEALTLIHIGRYEDRQKNQEFVLQMFHELLKTIPDAHLIMIGDGPRLGEFQKMAAGLNINDHVTFTGVVNGVQDYLQAADFFVFPSRYEGLGIVMIEAQTTGLFCIASKNVPEDAKVTDHVVFLDTDNTDEWIQTILKNQDYPRKDQTFQIENAGYNIRKQANNLRDIYMGLLKKTHLEDQK